MRMSNFKNLSLWPAMIWSNFPTIVKDTAKGGKYGAITGFVGVIAIKGFFNLHTLYNCNFSLPEKKISCGDEFIQSVIKDGYRGTLYGIIAGAGIFFLFHQWVIVNALLNYDTTVEENPSPQ